MGVWTNNRSLSAIVRTRVASALAVVVTLLAGPAFAQSMPQPEAFEPVDGNGVNLLSGKFQGPDHTISIGQPGQGGLSITVNYDTSGQGWRHDMAGLLSKEPVVGEGSDYPWWYVTLPQGPTSHYQQDVVDNFTLVSGYGSLVRVGTTVTHTGPDGTRSVFSQQLRSSVPFQARQGQIVRVERRNGEVWSFHYTEVEWQQYNTHKRLQSVTSNLGYQIHFEYLSNVFDSNWGELAKVTAFNNAVDWCQPTAFSCSYSQTWPHLIFTRSAAERTVTDGLNQVTRYFFTGGMLTGHSRPAAGPGQAVSITWGTGDNAGKVTAVNDGSGTWGYGFTPPPQYSPTPPYYELATYVTDPLGHQSRLIVSSSFDGPPAGRRINNPRSFRDPLLNLTTYDYETGRLVQLTHPEGNKEFYGYDDPGALGSMTRQAKPGSGLPDQTIIGCANIPVCGRPTSITDARGAVTDYTYDPTHGGVLTQTGPAPTPGAPRPQTRYTWEQRYAWYKQDGSGTITQAPGPVWVMVGQSQCMTGATC